MEQKINGYPKLYQVYSPEVENIFDYEIVIEEKVDGSQFSFQLLETGELLFKSKSVMLNYKDGVCLTNYNFTSACREIESIKDKLLHGFIYRGEYLKTPRHNKLAYGRVPKHNIVIYDVEYISEGMYMCSVSKYEHCEKIGLECVPCLYTGFTTKYLFDDMIKDFLTKESFLGKATIEGVVVKQTLVHTDRRLAFKYVREDFKEVKHVKERIVSESDEAVRELAKEYATPARYEKAVQYLNDSDKPLLGDMPDVPRIMERVARDVLEEEKDRISKELYSVFKFDTRFQEYENNEEAIFKTYWKDMSKVITSGVGKWYKQHLIGKL